MLFLFLKYIKYEIRRFLCKLSRLHSKMRTTRTIFLFPSSIGSSKSSPISKVSDRLILSISASVSYIYVPNQSDQIRSDR